VSVKYITFGTFSQKQLSTWCTGRIHRWKNNARISLLVI